MRMKSCWFRLRRSRLHWRAQPRFSPPRTFRPWLSYLFLLSGLRELRVPKGEHRASVKFVCTLVFIRRGSVWVCTVLWLVRRSLRWDLNFALFSFDSRESFVKENYETRGMQWTGKEPRKYENVRSNLYWVLHAARTVFCADTFSLSRFIQNEMYKCSQFLGDWEATIL